MEDRPTAHRGFGSGDVPAILAVLIWGTGVPVAKVVLDHVSVLAFLTVRSVFASILIFLALAGLERSISVERKDIGTLMLLGVVGVGLTHIGFLFGLNYTLASHTVVLVATGPVFATLMASLLGWERASVIAWCGIGVCFLGIWLLVRTGSTILGLNTLLGDVFVLASAACWAVYNLASKRLLSAYTPLKVTAYALALSNVVLLPLGIRSVLTEDWAAVAPEGWLGLTFTIVVALVLANTLWLNSVRAIGVARTSLYHYLIPVIGMFVAALLLKEHLTLQQWLGAGVVLLGIGLAASQPAGVPP